MIPLMLTLANGEYFRYSFPGTESQAEDHFQDHYFMGRDHGNRVESIYFEATGRTYTYSDPPYKTCIFCNQDAAGGIIHYHKPVCHICFAEINSR